MTSTLNDRPIAAVTEVSPAAGSAPRRVRTAVGYACMLLASAVFLYPLIWMVASSFRPGASILNDPLGFDPSAVTLRNWTGMFASTPLIRYTAGE